MPRSHSSSLRRGSPKWVKVWWKLSTMRRIESISVPSRSKRTAWKRGAVTVERSAAAPARLAHRAQELLLELALGEALIGEGQHHRSHVPGEVVELGRIEL